MKCDVCRKPLGEAKHFTRDGCVVLCVACWQNQEDSKQQAMQNASMKSEEIEVLANGAKQSKLAVRMDLLPWKAVLEVAEVLHYGAEKYGADNWRGIPADSHLNHALRHIALYKSGDQSEDHKSHVACRILMWLESIK